MDQRVITLYLARNGIPAFEICTDLVAMFELESVSYSPVTTASPVEIRDLEAKYHFV
jgi:hypothetical protein